MRLGEGLFIVGIGASAGGIEALEGLFRPMPADTGMAFVVVLHLAPDKVSHLDEVLQRFTAMKVDQAESAMPVEANRIYVIPPGAGLTLERGRFVVHGNGLGQRVANPIDQLFTSIAADQGEHAIAIVLSGGGSDGTLGIKAIKEGGGLALAQGHDHGRPQHESMPRSAIATGLVDLVLPVEAMAEKLVAYVRSYGVTAQLVDRLRGPASPAGGKPNARHQICAILRDQVGHDFSRYKEKTFLRRVQRRMQVVQLTDIRQYVERLRQDPEEVTLLFRDLLISVTSFFRDQEAFAALAGFVVPKLFEGKGGGTVRVWVPGCATGEEVYSIAILLRERMDTLAVPPKVQIFGTDIDEAALAVARAGRYAPSAVEEVSPQRLDRFFTEEGGSHTVAKEVRDLCIFSVHNVVRDPPFSRVDLISCRNLLIYFDAELQAQVIPVFHYALRSGGFLFLGISESVSQHPDLFTPLDKKHRLFQRRDHAGSQMQFPMLLPGPRLLSTSFEPRHGDASMPAVPLRRLVEGRVMERFAPAHVVCNRDGNIVYYSIRTGKYLEQPPGVPNRQILAMARKGLRLELRHALQEAIGTRRTISKENIAVELEDRVQLINLTVEPLGDSEVDPLFLVLFADLGPPLSREALAARGRAPGGETPDVARIEAELRDTRERLQSTIEEYETALEELKAANEELVSMNEELQSANEELETSKEELQSVNEELQTVNNELGSKVEQLNHANADLKNLFESTQVAVIFLDRDLVIRSFTPAVTGIFTLIPGDRGRPLTDIASHLDYGGLLVDDVRAVIATGEPHERRVARRDQSIHYLVRILPYRGGDNAVSGALVTFLDITAPVEAERRQRLLVQELNHRVRNMLGVVSAIATQTLARTSSPEAFLESFMGRIDALGRSHSLLSRERWGEVGLREILLEQLTAQAGGADRVELTGPPILLKPKAALAFGLVAHELATNALKYGALSTPEGRVLLTWSLERHSEGQVLRVRWREKDGPPVAAPDGKGFGSDLIEREVRYDLGGTSESEFLQDGLCVTLSVPADPMLLVEADHGQPAGRDA
jgi:two-component system CheB/CheR fusion protein